MLTVPYSVLYNGIYLITQEGDGGRGWLEGWTVANIEVCTWEGVQARLFFLLLYCTARQQTFPESQLLETWPASIYGHLREWTANLNVVFI